MANTGGINAVGINASVPDVAYRGVAAVTIAVTAPVYRGVAGVSIDVTHRQMRGVAYPSILVAGTARGVAAVSIAVSLPVARGVAPVTLNVSGTARGTAPVRVNVVGGESALWRAIAIIDGVDRSARLTGTVRITHQKSASGIAELDLLPEVAGFDPLAWAGREVQLYREDATTGWRVRRFTGIVSEPAINPDSGVISLLCTTDNQRRIEAMTREAIDTLTGGYHSPHVFDDNATHWRYAQDRLSTRPVSLWADTNGVLQVTDLAAKVTPDITFTAADRIRDSLRITPADKSQMINRIRCTLDFRFERLKQRNVSFYFRWLHDICTYLKAQFPLPQKSMVAGAANGAGWDLQGNIAYVDAWPAGVYDCGLSSTGMRDVRIWGFKKVGIANATDPDNSTIDVADPNLSSYCIGATFALGKRWAQTVTETYHFDVTASVSIAANGERGHDRDYGIEAESEPTAWEQDNAYGYSVTGEGNTVAGGSMQGMPAGAVVLSNGDWLYEATEAEQTGRAAMVTAQHCILGMARTSILTSHLTGRVEFSVPFNPFISLAHTVRLDESTIVQAAVWQLVDELDITTGNEQTHITLALSNPEGVGVAAETPLDPLEAPASDPLTEYDRTRWLEYRIGGRTDSPAYSDEWDGYVSNYLWDPTDLNPHSTDPSDPQTVVYPESFRVNTPEITDIDRQAISAQAEQTFNVDIPTDTLEVA